MEKLVLKLRNEAVKINSYKNKEIDYQIFNETLCKFLKELDELISLNIDEALSILWYFVHEKTFEDKNLSKHKILSNIKDLECQNRFIEFYHLLGKVYEAVERLDNH